MSILVSTDDHATLTTVVYRLSRVIYGKHEEREDLRHNLLRLGDATGRNKEEAIQGICRIADQNVASKSSIRLYVGYWHK